ncbi:MAG: aminotransferase class V-fold PLP-dependent enzyme [Burkholderiaceae bacterium]|jgi:alanine-glyoxylate transaminase/serine-glyoxylate transaminase/serine-pyruvate transaminase|nr:MAG: aminotransferase class V-fold PLP-dependent enzyme [Burkholderiaceae bacterium]TBR75675.1 MAG: aminotransferase class V-fold PLP-dependent enzyme [Burkholderiaceae bacterium]
MNSDTMNQAKRIPGHRFLHSPGPTRVPDEVVHAMSRQPMDLADPRLLDVIGACESGLRRLLRTREAQVFMYSANGHGAWEAVITNLVAPGQTVLVPGTGHFSESWAVQTEALGGRVVRTPYLEGFPIDAGAVEQALRADIHHEIVAVFAVHTDTASSVTSDLRALRTAINAAGHPALFVVDVVASLGAAPFAMDELGANVVIGASQKGLMVPPGLGFVAVDSAAMAVARRNPMPRFYWDWERRSSELAYRKFCGTPPQSLLLGLEAALSLIFQEGVDQIIARHRLIARAVHAAVDGWSGGGALQFFSRVPEARSTSVTTVLVQPGIDPEAIREVARERFQVAIAGGLGPLAGRVFRIGHLGDMNPAMILGCLAGVEAALKVQGVSPGRGGMQQAVACLAEG